MVDFALAGWLRFLATVALDSAALFGLAWLAALCLKRRSAALRCALWSVAFLGVLLVSIAYWAPVKTRLNLLPEPAFAAGPLIAGVVGAPSGTAPAARLPATEETGASTSAWLSAAVAAGGIWCAVFLFLLARFGFGVGRARALAHRAVCPLEPTWRRMSASLSASLGLRSPVPIRICAEPVTPMVWGFRRPLVLLPDDAESWSHPQRRMTLAHELAHVARRDLWMTPIVHLLCALFWFNPLAWTARRALFREREMACDDQALHLGAKASDYADHILDMARRLRLNSAAALSMSRVSELEGRLLAILEPGAKRTGISRRTLAILTAAGLMATLPLALTSPWRPAPADFHGHGHAVADLSHGASAFSDQDMARLAQHGIAEDYLQTLAGMGYRRLTVDQAIQLHELIDRPENLRQQAIAIFGRLEPIADPERVCMRADQVVDRPNVAVEIDGRTYYSLPHCSTLLLNSPGFRYAVDPYSGNTVDKARATLAATGDGSAVFYFENPENLRSFNGE